MSKTVRIGCGAGFWGDTPEGPAQLVRRGGIDYLVLDYLAEITMSILARMKKRDPALGYATDFVTMVALPLAKEISDKGIRIVTNAGGVNPSACRDALSKVFEQAGVTLNIALVHGDDLTGHVEALRADDTREMFTDERLPDNLSSINAYLGAFPIARALDEGADIVLTGRTVDSALALGPLIHEFGWQSTDHDKLAAGSLAGHILECGTQTTGGIFTDWQSIKGWDRMGFPIAECCEDGSFELSKPAQTGGLINRMTVGEQVVYEVGDPKSYVLPDVTCDFSNVKITEAGVDRVRVEGVSGRPPSRSYKVSSTFSDGYRSSVTMMIAGRDAAAKAKAVGSAILLRASRLMAQEHFEDFSETLIEVLGAESTYGAHSRANESREVILKIAVRHQDKAALNIFAREIYPAASSMAQGLTGFAGGRPGVQPVIRLFSFLIDKSKVPVTVEIDGERLNVEIHNPNSEVSLTNDSAAAPVAESPTGDMIDVPLIAIAHGRSGDKGDTANIGILARRPEFTSAIRRSLTADSVREYFSHIVTGGVKRFEWPGLWGFNFLLHGGLGGGGVASLRHDPQGKAYAQMLLDIPVEVPRAWLEPAGPLADWSDKATTLEQV